mgnify:CR=1 FL=1
MNVHASIKLRMGEVDIMLHNVDTVVCAEYSTSVSIDTIKLDAQRVISYLYPYKNSLNLSIMITDNKYITELNSTFRGIPESTDVLSFSPIETIQPGEPSDDVFNNLLEDQLGDIVISYEEIEKQSHTYKQSREEVLSFLLIHGLLHLSGYDHATQSELVQMQQKESELLNHLNLSSQIVYEMYDAQRLKG